MPWQQPSPVDERERFIQAHRLDLYTMVELCARYGVSRKTGYKWLDRFEEDGRHGLRDRSRAPHQCPHRITPAVAAGVWAAAPPQPPAGPPKPVGSVRPPPPARARPAARTTRAPPAPPAPS